MANVTLMYPHEPTDQSVVKDVMGGNALWEEKFIRRA
jgi:hypothetical protein